MDERQLEAALAEARAALTRGPVYAVHREAKEGASAQLVGKTGTGEYIPDAPGLYAVYARDMSRVMGTLGRVVPVGEDGLLYVGKAQKSIAARDVRQHFGTGKTGRSTLRRTLAALLERDLDLWPVPREGKPGSAAPAGTFALNKRSDEALTRWMTQSLELRVWVPGEQLAGEGAPALADVERRLITELDPPLNLTYVGPRPEIKAGRARMSALAMAQAETVAPPLKDATMLGDLFRRRPQEFGLRGNIGLWLELRVRFADTPMPEDEDHVLDAVRKAKTEILADALPYDGDSVNMPRFDRGGMSAGLVHLGWWPETGLPLILERWHLWRAVNETEEQLW